MTLLARGLALVLLSLLTPFFGLALLGLQEYRPEWLPLLAPICQTLLSFGAFGLILCLLSPVNATTRGWLICTLLLVLLALLAWPLRGVAWLCGLLPLPLLTMALRNLDAHLLGGGQRAQLLTGLTWLAGAPVASVVGVVLGYWGATLAALASTFMLLVGSAILWESVFQLWRGTRRLELAAIRQAEEENLGIRRTPAL